MKKLLKLLGFKYCILCGKLKKKGKIISWTDDGEVNYKAFTCQECLQNYRED
jgi:hypothetical protein